MIRPLLIILGRLYHARNFIPLNPEEFRSNPVSRKFILCVGLPDLDRPQAGHPLAQRRVDLLAIEQNGWVLAARDPRCKVVSTRTELGWAMKNGQICVWAPSKIVLDATQGPASRPRDSVALAGWFAEHMEASELVVIGESLPEDVTIPARAVTV